MGRAIPLSHQWQGPIVDTTASAILFDRLIEIGLLVQRAADGIEGFPQGLGNELLRPVVVLHGALDRGTPLARENSEALAPHHADWLEGQIHSFLGAVEQGARLPRRLFWLQ
jgi:hypothetical protein